MGLKQARQDIKDALNDAKPDFNVYRTMPGTPVLPALVVIPAEETVGKQERVGASGMVWFIDVHVMVPYNDPESAQDQLDDELSADVPGSVMHHLKGMNLSGNIMDAYPGEIKWYGAGTAGNAPYFGAQIRLEVREC